MGRPDWLNGMPGRDESFEEWIENAKPVFQERMAGFVWSSS
jgi:hypothetical protein